MTILESVRRRDEELRAESEVAIKPLLEEIVGYLKEKRSTRFSTFGNEYEYEWVFKFEPLTDYQMDALEEKVKELLEDSENPGTWVEVSRYWHPENAYLIGGFCEKKKKGLFSKKNPYDLLLVRIRRLHWLLNKFKRNPH